MILPISELLMTYKDYADPMGKIRREVKNKSLFPVIKGLYETDPNTPGLYLTSYIYGPSYVSFEYALSFHGLIPERVYAYTNATFNKQKSKQYKTSFGLYTYRDVPTSAFPFGVKAYQTDDYSYIMATPEKALCDQLYIAPPQTSMKQLKVLMFEDLRIDEDSFSDLDFDKLLFLTDQYRRTNMKLLKKILNKARSKV